LQYERGNARDNKDAIQFAATANGTAGLRLLLSGIHHKGKVMAFAGGGVVAHGETECEKKRRTE
jgi:hypothetical protein